MKNSTGIVDFVLTASLLIIVAFSSTSCTDNARARRWGGTETINLEANEVANSMTWKDDGSLWVCTTDTSTGETHFREHSSLGMVEGHVILKPKKP